MYAEYCCNLVLKASAWMLNMCKISTWQSDLWQTCAVERAAPYGIKWVWVHTVSNQTSLNNRNSTYPLSGHPSPTEIALILCLDISPRTGQHLTLAQTSLCKRNRTYSLYKHPSTRKYHLSTAQTYRRDRYRNFPIPRPLQEKPH